MIKKPEIKKLSNIELLYELPFYDELSITEVSKAFKRYARSYKVEIVDHKDPFVQLEVSKSSIKDLFKDLLNETKGFKYQVTVAVLLSKKKGNGEIEYSSIYFNSMTKTLINSLIGSSFVELPNELKNPKKGLVNIKNNDDKCFLWCHVRHLNLIKNILRE